MRFHTRKWVKPGDMNPNRTLFGGRLLEWIDEECALYSIVQLENSKCVTKYMSEIDFKPKLKQKTKVQRPKLYKVMLLNDDYTPREFVVLILKAEFRLDESQAEVVMMTAHQKGVCVVSVYPRDVAETKATRAIDAAVRLGYPLQFTVEPE